MSSSIIPSVTKTPIGASAFGVVTVPDVNGLYQNQAGYISNTGQTTIEIQIISILGINSILCKLYGGPSNTGADLHVYDGGSLFFDIQEISPGFVGRIGPTGNTGPTGPTGGTGGTPDMSNVAITGGRATDVLNSDTVTSGAAVLAVAAVGPAPTTMKWSAASAASASSPGICGGVAVAAVGAVNLPLKVQSTGITGVIADALWDSLPATSDVDKPVYLSKTAGHYTIDVSAFTTTDRVQSIGILHAGGTGACRIKLMLSGPQAAAVANLAAGNIGTITSGLISGSVVASATAVSPGAMTAAQNNRLNTLASGGWIDVLANLGIVPALTQFQPEMNLSSFPALWGSNFTDGTTEPGCVIPASGTNIALTGRIVDNANTSPWMVAYDAVLPVPASGKYSYFGLSDGGTQYLYLGSNYGAGGQATTKMILMLTSGVTLGYGPVIDGLRHRFAIWYDAVNTLTITVDDVVVATFTATSVPAYAMHMWIDTNATVKLFRHTYGTR